MYFNQNHRTSVQIRFNDIDVLGHVNNAVYQHYLDLARLDYFITVFKEKPDWKKEGLVMASIKVDYIEPILLYDKLEVISTVTHIGNKSLTMKQFLAVENSVKAECQAVMVCFDPLKRETIEIPQQWRKSIENFESNFAVD